jgi:Na+/serine symporter
MTISKTADHILSHPYFAEACERVLEGNASDMRILLIDLMAHVAVTQNSLDARVYMKKRENTYPNINSSIREMACSCDLFFHLPMPRANMQLALELNKTDKSQLEFNIPIDGANRRISSDGCMVVLMSQEAQIAL